LSWTSGIGAQAARLFAAEGSRVVVGGRRETEGSLLAAELGSRVRSVVADVTVESDVEALVGHAMAEFGRLDVMINNARSGGLAPGGLESIDLERFWDILHVHVGGVLAGLKYAARVMLGQGSGSITALRQAVSADPDFGLAVADLEALTGAPGHHPGRRPMNWERHHIEVVAVAAAGQVTRAADLLREHLASVGCDPLAVRITARLREPAGKDDDFEDLASQLPSCHAAPWPGSQ